MSERVARYVAGSPGPDDDVAQRLERFLAARIDGATRVEVIELTRSTEGFSQETFSFDVEITRGRNAVEKRGYVVKREPVAGLLEPYDLEPEFRVLHALSDDPLPSPPTPWFERDPAVLERPFYVMERLAGDVPIPAVSLDGRGPFDDPTRVALAPNVAGALAELHAIDWRARGFDFLDAPAVGRAAAEREVERWRDRIARSALPLDPIVAESLLWLRRSVPVTDEITLVHGDYRLGNFLVTGTGRDVRLSGILDWEMVHLGDPLEDLAWCACPLWRAGTEFASGLVPPAELAALYAAASGRAVDEDRLRFYEVLAVVKMIAIMLTGVRAFIDGRTRDVRMAIFDHQLPFLHLMLAMLRNLFAGGS
jgi:aminoglycoside phosphotransferase (APT) family kinase protein